MFCAKNVQKNNIELFLNNPNKEQNAAIIILFSFYEFKTPNKMSIEFAMEFMKPGIA